MPLEKKGRRRVQVSVTSQRREEKKNAHLAGSDVERGQVVEAELDTPVLAHLDLLKGVGATDR